MIVLPLLVIAGILLGILLTLVLATVSRSVHEYMAEVGRGEILLLCCLISICVLLGLFWRP